MTREEADKIQASIDEYIEYRDGKKVAEPAEESELDLEPPPDDPKAQAAAKHKKLQNKFKRALMKNPAAMLKMQLVPIVADLIPEIRLEEGGMDMVALVAPLLSLFAGKAIEESTSPMFVNVVDGAPLFDPKTMDEGEYRKLYGIMVPGDLVKAGLDYRSSMEFGRMAMAKFGKQDISNE